MKLISNKKAKEIWEANDGDPCEGLWVLSGEYNEDDEPLLTTICPEDGFPEDERLFFVLMEIMGINPDYLETHYMISVFIDANEYDIRSLCDIREEQGMGGLWEKAESLTNEFQSRYDGTNWGEELDWHDTLDQFLTEKLQ